MRKVCPAPDGPRQTPGEHLTNDRQADIVSMLMNGGCRAPVIRGLKLLPTGNGEDSNFFPCDVVGTRYAWTKSRSSHRNGEDYLRFPYNVVLGRPRSSDFSRFVPRASPLYTRT